MEWVLKEFSNPQLESCIAAKSFKGGSGYEKVGFYVSRRGYGFVHVFIFFCRSASARGNVDGEFHEDGIEGCACRGGKGEFYSDG